MRSLKSWCTDVSLTYSVSDTNRGPVGFTAQILVTPVLR